MHQIHRMNVMMRQLKTWQQSTTHLWGELQLVTVASTIRMRSLFWDVAQCKVVVSYLCSEWGSHWHHGGSLKLHILWWYEYISTTAQYMWCFKDWGEFKYSKWNGTCVFGSVVFLHMLWQHLLMIGEWRWIWVQIRSCKRVWGRCTSGLWHHESVRYVPAFERRLLLPSLG
jgi:hypothetical protein